MAEKWYSKDDDYFGRLIGQAFVRVEKAMDKLPVDSDDYERLRDIYNDLHSIWSSDRPSKHTGLNRRRKKTP